MELAVGSFSCGLQQAAGTCSMLVGCWLQVNVKLRCFCCCAAVVWLQEAASRLSMHGF
jgi:hypothetical protein